MIQKPSAFAQLEQLKRELAVKPVHGARSFDLDQVRYKKLDKGASFTRVTSPILPKTGVITIDSLNWKVSDLLRLTKNSIIDFPKAAIKGGFYGAIGGALVGLINFAAVTRKVNFWTVGIGTCAVFAGAMVGAGFKVAQECWQKLKEFKNIIF
jgi:hypothetical protein